MKKPGMPNNFKLVFNKWLSIEDKIGKTGYLRHFENKLNNMENKKQGTCSCPGLPSCTEIKDNICLACGLPIYEYWDCPTCGYRITDSQYNSVRYDFGCPRCDTPIANFENITV
jgi:rubrerythrin